MFLKGDSIIIKQAFREIYSKKPILSNLFSFESSGDEFYKTDNSLILRKADIGFYRIYLQTIDKKDIIKALKSLRGTYVINIPTKEKIEEWAVLLKDCGFNLIGIYERFFNSNIKSKGKFTAKYADITHFDHLKTMMYNNFNKYTDCLPDNQLLQDMIVNNQVIIHEENDELSGLFIYTFQGKKCYFNCWYDKSNNGLYLLFNMYNLMSQHQISYSYFWINSKNENVKKIYTLLGSRPDGLKDYIFLKIKHED
jgi:hypothetical protein